MKFFSMAILYSRKTTFQWRCIMNEEQLKGRWLQLKGKIQRKWGNLTDDDLAYINGSKKLLIGKVIERQGIAKEIAEKELDEL